MSEAKPILWTGGDAPNRNARLSVVLNQSWQARGYTALWQEGYCGCPDCHRIVGFGATPEAAIADYWEQWEEKHELGASND